MRASQFFTAAVLLLASCAQNSKTREAGLPAPSRPEAEALLPDLSQADSLELYAYPDPSNRRLHSRAFIRERRIIDSFARLAAADTARLTECPHNGKMYFYRGGEVFKTVYLATSDSCRYLAFARGSQPVFVPLSEAGFRLADSLLQALPPAREQ